MIQTYVDMHPDTPASEITFSIDYRLPAKTPRTIQGKTIKSKTTVRIWLADIIPLVKLSLSTSVFVSIDKVHSQCRGSCIGNPASPPISEVPIAFKEFMWLNSYKINHADSVFLTRYVDNRLLAIPKSFFRQTKWRILTELLFYGFPVELEKEPAMDFLGFRIDTVQGTVTYIQPSQPWQFRSIRSAGTIQSLLAGLNSRIHLIGRHTYPKAMINKSTQELLQIYQSVGYNYDDLLRSTSKVRKLYKIDVSPV